MDLKARVTELRSLIRAADDEYYNLGTPALEDQEYDALFRELRELESAHPELQSPDSPTRRVGAPLPSGTGFEQGEHLVPMLSIESLTGFEQVEEFVERARKGLELEDDASLRWVIEPKYDGVSANLLYRDRVFVRGLSRGDGQRGEDISQNLKTIRSIPLTLPDSAPLGQIEVRGEVIMSREGFEHFREQHEAATGTGLRNARNTVAGSLKLQDPTQVAKRPMVFLAFGVGHADQLEAESMSDLHDRLGEWGFSATDPFAAAEDAAGIQSYHQNLESRREELPYEMDGVVAKIDDMRLQRRLGRTARAPRWVLAFKFAPRRATTRVLSIVAQVGRTGAVTPVANLDPIELAGVTVSRATLHNWGLLAERDVREGDSVEVERAGDVIPKVVAVHVDQRSNDSEPVTAPTQCPTCESELQPDKAFLYCGNIECPDQLRGRVAHMAGRRALDIDRLGEKFVEQLMQAGLIRSIEDVYRLPDREDEIVALDGWGARSFEKLRDEVDKAKTPTLARFLNAIGIRNVGEQTAKDLAAHFGSMPALAAANEEQLVEVDGVGPEVAASIRGFFEIESNARFLREAQALGLRVQDEAPKASGGDMEGRTFCFTGGLERLSRDDAKAIVEGRGARTVGSISAKVTDVVAGTKAGSKLEKAKRLGLAIHTEQEFLDLVDKQ